RRLLASTTQPSIGAKLLACVEAFEGIDLQEDGQGDDDADAGRRLQHGHLGRVVQAGGNLDVFLQSADGRIERVEQRQVGLDATAYAVIVDVGEDGGAFGLVFDVVGDGRQVELASGGVDVAVQLGALTDQT